MRGRRWLVAGLLLAAACGGPGREPDGAGAYALIETSAGDVRVELEIVETPEERLRGLMGRASLPQDAGMAFLFPDGHRGAFHMKDTAIPLSIAFFDARGEILAILDMQPCLAEPCPAYDPEVPYRGALEVNQGAFERWGVAVGDRIEIRRG